MIGGPAGAAAGAKLGGAVSGLFGGGGGGAPQLPTPGFGDPNRFNAPTFQGGGGNVFNDPFSREACALAASRNIFPPGCGELSPGPFGPAGPTPAASPAFTNGCMTGVNIPAVLPADQKMILSSRPGYTLVRRAGCEPFQIQDQYAKENKIRLPKKTAKAKITAAEFKTLSTANAVRNKLKTLSKTAGLTTSTRGTSRRRAAPKAKSCGCN